MKNDPVSLVLSDAEAVTALAGLLPEEQNGLARLLALLAEDLQKNGEVLSDVVTPRPFLEPNEAN